jgi:hypothetical protein
MRGFVRASLAGLALLASAASFAQTPNHIGRYLSMPEDIAAITRVTEDFQSALVKKDRRTTSGKSSAWSGPTAAPRRKTIRNRSGSGLACHHSPWNGGMQDLTPMFSGDVSPLSC